MLVVVMNARITKESNTRDTIVLIRQVLKGVNSIELSVREKYLIVGVDQSRPNFILFDLR